MENVKQNKAEQNRQTDRQINVMWEKNKNK